LLHDIEPASEPDIDLVTASQHESPNTPPIEPHIEFVPTQILDPVPELRRSTRNSHPPSHLADYICNLSTSSPESTSSGILHPLSDYHSHVNLSKSLSTFAMSIVTDIEPRDFKEARQHQC
jgi:hypothetical protein